MGAPFSGGEVHGPPIRDVGGKIEWYSLGGGECVQCSLTCMHLLDTCHTRRVERFVQLGAGVTDEAREERDRCVLTMSGVACPVFNNVP